MAESAPSATKSATSGWPLIPAAVAAAATLWFATFLPGVAAGRIPELVIPWVSSLGIDLAFRLDGLALAFALLICGIGAMVFLYAATYFATDRRRGSLLLTLVAFAVSMLGLVLADDAITLFVFWEATTVTSWLLVGFDHERASARAAALQALLVTGGGGLALLAGLLLMVNATGTFRLSGMNAAGDLLRASPLYVPVFWLVAAGAFTKSAQFPFQFWLPNAMAAPTPVSAYLHSATMVKAGVFLLARLTPALGGTSLWTALLVPVGAFTMLLASVWAMRQTDLKLMLAYTTVMALGMITMLLGIGTPAAVVAAMTFLLVHAFYKAGLFLSVGMIEKGAGTRDYPAVGGLAGAMPLTAAVVALAALSMAGLPPFFGFIGKEMIYESTGHAAAWTTAAAFAANALIFACAGMVALRPFLGPRRSPKDKPADPGWGLALGPAILAALGLLCGLLPALVEPVVAPMTLAVTGAPMEGHLALWHGLGNPLLLSLATFAAGALLYLALDAIRDALAAAEPRLPRTEAWYDALLAALLAASGQLTGAVQNGRMTSYLRNTFLVLALLIAAALVLGHGAWPAITFDAQLIDWAVAAIVVASIAVVLRTPSRLTAITALGGVGAGIAIVFVLYGAIDVAMTQLFVEILVVVFLAIAMVRLPPSGAIPFRAGNAAVAVLLGVTVTLAVLAVLATPLDTCLTAFFEAKSYPEAHGRNVVNVILVDFRGFDTMGEISVIVVAGIAAIAALKAGRRPGR
ncbi:MAG: hydrogen gas-evolving membrane-bound hydrogenase subunit E [Amaricoccus sp.]